MEGSIRLVGILLTKATIPIIKSGADSPSILAMPRIVKKQRCRSCFLSQRVKSVEMILRFSTFNVIPTFFEIISVISKISQIAPGCLMQNSINTR